MVRKMIQIDTEKCNGCGACAAACHEGAIAMVNGKAHLLRDDYCDGLGNCLPACPTGAITFTEREAPAYDPEAVKAHLAAKSAEHVPFAGCPGSRSQLLRESEPAAAAPAVSQLRQWPVQIQLVPINAPYFNGANLLIAADCAAYACGDFHSRFMRGKVTLIGCPKLDDVDYTDKLLEIIQTNEIKSVTVARMEVPCCGGIEQAVKTALQRSGKFLPWQVVTIARDGTILD